MLEIQPAPRRQTCGAGRLRLSPCCHLPAAQGHRSGVFPTRVAPPQHIQRQQGVDKTAPSSFPSTLRHAPWYPQSCIPIPNPATFSENQCHQCQGGYGEENESTSNTEASWHCCEPPGHPTIVIPRLQISDLTLYPFWFSSGLILSGCEQRQRRLRNRDGPSAMPTPRAHRPQTGLSWWQARTT